MEFNFRSNYQGRTRPLPAPSSISSKTPHDPPQYSAGGECSRYDFLRQYIDIERSSVVLERELEKTRLREQIIAEELARNRMLEAELRKEVSIDRFSLRMPSSSSVCGVRVCEGGSNSSFFEPVFGRRPKSVMREVLESQPVESITIQRNPKTLAWEVESRHEGMPFQRRPKAVMQEPEWQHRHEAIPLQCHPNALLRRVESQPDEDVVFRRSLEIVALPKPKTSTLSGSKRTAETFAGGACELPEVGAGKKPQKWTCSVCGVSANSEKGLEAHLAGKKHKSNESEQKTLQKGIKSKGKAKECRKKKSFCCKLCNVTVENKRVMARHLKGKKHLSKLERKSKP
ncbi:uncharacterized protein LOC131158287 [Malania oleifera]|uniref:uncharacterized protein LOC131158287 n=1 Tax=Malania oleifera TaxID=397392 RepID=UPI0025AE0C73|nr:uncharacterized protein LOC131158287 [Malania oleifera]